MAYNTFTLSNGLRIIQSPSLTNIAYAGFAIDAGTRDEESHEWGMAHMVEHMLFKGTQKRKAWHILNRMEKVGGDLNAFTNKEETVLYCAFLTEHFERAVELLVDLAFHSQFPEAERSKEAEVVLDEIDSYEDSPAELIYDDFEDLLFPNCPLGRNILGMPQSVRSFDSAMLKHFFDKHYVTQNMVFFIQGNVPFTKVIKQLEKLTEGIATVNVQKNRWLPEQPVGKTVRNNRGTHQAHIMVGGRAYPANTKKRTALYLLTNILGGPGMNSRLNVSLREKRGLVYNVEANMVSYTDTGVFSIYMGCGSEDIDQCTELVQKELKQMREHALTDAQLRAAKKQIIGQIGVAGDNFENNALDMGKVFLHHNRWEEPEDVFRRINALTKDELQETANEIFSEKNLMTLIYY